ncbi:glutaredoxin family protein [Chitinimonas koreensis]|uniref:glutaredoxin family protein n=1 Tax=Chitinimonas koreensis TaxID=356302 RepID=UPI0003FCDA54|nr:glutaredoxin family protein [Chitinimonas koreensis]QNM95854.1 glutaredoxin family protein [Chitinimonas koreensis]
MKSALLIALLLAAPFGFAAKVYQWKDANGNVIFSDQPPPGQQVKEKDVKANVITTSGGNFITREAMRKNPITLWSNNCGEPCDNARALLGKRGVPYALRNPQASTGDYDQLKKLAGDVVVPVLQVGDTALKGFQDTSWAAALDQAGYPKTADPTIRQPAGK